MYQSQFYTIENKLNFCNESAKDTIDDGCICLATTSSSIAKRIRKYITDPLSPYPRSLRISLKNDSH